jgi:hypothetical protein
MRRLVVGVAAAVAVAAVWTPAFAALTAADRKFLVEQCRLSADDVDVIAKLAPQVEKQAAAAALARDCRKLTSLKVSRDHYRTLLGLKPGEAVPPSPPGLDYTYLTDEEFLEYARALNGPGRASPPADEPASTDPRCGVTDEEMKVVPTLDRGVQANISRWMAAHECKKLLPLRRTREYLGRILRLKPGEPLPMPPAGWDADYLTEEEFGQYVKILNR